MTGATRRPSIGWMTAAIAATLVFIALGTWQVERRAWKLDLLARVDARVTAPAVPAPGRPQWSLLSRNADEYRHVCANGRWMHPQETLVQAVTRLGPGYWVLTPLLRDDGSYLMVNRGYVEPAVAAAATRMAGQTEGPVQVCGLLRMSEPGGAFLRRNLPESNRWYSRDVAAIAASRGLPPAAVAPYFVDADDTPNPGGWPRGGLTVVQFRNAHLVYALTWYSLALVVPIGLWGARRAAATADRPGAVID